MVHYTDLSLRKNSFELQNPKAEVELCFITGNMSVCQSKAIKFGEICILAQ